MALTRMLSGPWSTAMDIVSPSTAALDALYGVCPCARSAPVEEMLMMEPPPVRFMAGMA